MPAKKTNDELNGSARFMPKSDVSSSQPSDTNLLSDEPETPSVLAEPDQIETADAGGGDKLPKQSAGAGKWVVIVLLVLALGGLGYWYWYKTSQLNSQLSDKASQITTLEADKAKLAADLKKAEEVNVKQESDDDMIVAAAKLNCEAKIDPKTGKNLVFVIGTIGPKNEKIVYSNDKKFAKINSACRINASEQGGGALSVYKKATKQWVFVWTGQQSGPDKVTGSEYGIPKDWYDDGPTTTN